ncbi:MAG TPA: hypothetical protein VFO94_17955 [Gammaproteobacteria bacterium]|nr:hypothetical protein [Gammaproteobacteria bacterium]
MADDDLRAARAAGYDDAQIVEIVRRVAMNVWTNYVNSVARTALNFPAIDVRQAV